MNNDINVKEVGDKYKSSRFFYVIEAAVEYLVTILVGGTYLAKLTSYIGMPDNLTAILTSFVSLGFGFQILAIGINTTKPMKRWVIPVQILTELLFTSIYVFPFVELNSSVKPIIFLCCLLVAHILLNLMFSPKIAWLMGLVPDSERGKFTATKEIVSLISGMVFSFVMGNVYDGLEEKGNIEGAFTVACITIIALTLFHTSMLLFIKEKPTESTNCESHPKKQILSLFTDKRILKVLPVSILWHIAAYSATPFYGTYQIKELGFSMTFISILSAAYSIVRSTFSLPLGRFADKHSFVSMLNICFSVVGMAFFVNVFTTPENGKILYTVYYMLYAIATAGINGGLINLMFDNTSVEKRNGALALQGTLGGFAGFFTTLAISPLVKYIQENGNKIFGISVYAQQVTSLIAAIGVIILIVYLNTVLKVNKKKNII